MGDHGYSRIEQIRVPPQSVEAEQAVLGGLMLAPDAYWQVADMVNEADFYRRDHQLIWRAIAEAADSHPPRPYDAVTLGEWFESQGLAEQVAGGAYLVELASTTPSAANIRAYAEIVADKAKLRQLIEIGTGIVNNGFVPDGRDSAEIIADAQQAVGSLATSKGHRLKSVNDGLSEMVDGMQRRLNAGGTLGTSFGLSHMDDMTGGKQPGDLIIIAARPSMGKTTLALQGCLAAGRPLIFSFETMAEKLLARMTAHCGRLPLRWILFPQDAPDFAFERITEAARIVKSKLTASIYDGRRLTSSQLRAIAIREHAKSPVREIVIDHFGHMRRAGKGRADAEQGEDMKEFKALARELNVPVIVLMQLNRGVETRTDKRPMLSDLRECGAAEEDADIVAMLYRDVYYNPQGPLKEYAEILLRKNRDGEPGELWTKPCLPEMRFDECEAQSRPSGSVTSIEQARGVPSRSSARAQPSRISTTYGDR
ncbi:replicative DNA helicase [Luteimonas cucumeris]|uniref:DNA 5'-3' helicase n=1 Tax=Luteimonas cucumeris TaxID=985012 RepID=A0A562LAZ3_9GAMM|nr:replicative DNA helicase [Luteimonas cucumeris]TWI04833.1 replicative DNA helicase [Luteimonas cucumeris]